ncbi:hypothetical protein HPC49_11445 [Pyxidicoccus fallax]|uniref:SPOR domain-containing protein n=1 Tax=Pyxidicoccus fallax TaxID=394095 RepID=A0A848LHR1_9BACT|nr:hypothetical protein [Pyxidicoccus fallax]NMO17071.1 hypothetical protein [Pyxidicoccus fallax]NPC78853.1 hypothetical protein [Pyxidicoccus fallax]
MIHAWKAGALMRALLPVFMVVSSVWATGAGAEPAKPLQRGYLVILGGGKAPADAEAVVKNARTPKELALAAGYPRVVESASVKGLNPGFFIAVAGACASKRAAEEARDVLGFLSLDGVYLREVQVPEEQLKDCPRLQPAELGNFDPSSFRVVKKAPLDTARPTLTWVIRKTRPKGGCDIFDVAVQAGDTVLAHERFEATGCNLPLGRHTSWHEVSIVEVASARFVRLVYRAEWHDNGSTTHKLLDFACGGLSEVAEIGDRHDDFVEEISPVEGRSPREALRMRWRHSPCYNCRPDNEVLLYERSAECRYTAKEDSGG